MYIRSKKDLFPLVNAHEIKDGDIDKHESGLYIFTSIHRGSKYSETMKADQAKKIMKFECTNAQILKEKKEAKAKAKKIADDLAQAKIDEEAEKEAETNEGSTEDKKDESTVIDAPDVDKLNKPELIDIFFELKLGTKEEGEALTVVKLKKAIADFTAKQIELSSEGDEDLDDGEDDLDEGSSDDIEDEDLDA